MRERAYPFNRGSSIVVANVWAAQFPVLGFLLTLAIIQKQCLQSLKITSLLCLGGNQMSANSTHSAVQQLPGSVSRSLLASEL